jgi:hypothetical protein
MKSEFEKRLDSLKFDGAPIEKMIQVIAEAGREFPFFLVLQKTIV